MNRTSQRRPELPREALAQFCRRHHIHELAVFGSYLRPDFGPSSDLDFLATFDEDVRLPMSQLLAIEDELAALVGRPVDLILRPSLMRSMNTIRKHAILDSAVIVYAA